MRANSLLRAATLTLVLTAMPLVRPARAGIDVPCGPCSTVPATLILGGRDASGSADPATTYTVVVYSVAGQRMVGSVVVLAFDDCAGVALCATQPDPDLHVLSCAPARVAKVTDVSGRATFRLVGAASGQPGGPCPSAGCVRVYADGVLLRNVQVVTPDLDGGSGVGAADLSVWLDLYFGQQPCALADFDGSGELTAGDLAWWLDFALAGGSAQGCAGSLCP